MTTNPRMDGILPIKFIEGVSVGLNGSRTNLARAATFMAWARGAASRTRSRLVQRSKKSWKF